MPNYAVFTGCIDQDQIHIDFVRARSRKAALASIVEIRGYTGHLVADGDNPCALTPRQLRGMATKLARLTTKKSREAIARLREDYGMEEDE